MTKTDNEVPFWEAKSLSQMSRDEWEALCDGCGQCCLVLLIDDDTGTTWETDLSCRLFDAQSRRCENYANRHELVSDCVSLTPDNAGALDWMPETCAYRRLANGKDLPSWHPLRTGRAESVVEAGVAVAGNLRRENTVDPDDFEDYITRPRCQACK